MASSYRPGMSKLSSKAGAIAIVESLVYRGLGKDYIALGVRIVVRVPACICNITDIGVLKF